MNCYNVKQIIDALKIKPKEIRLDQNLYNWLILSDWDCILKEELKVNSLIGQGETKIYVKDNIPVDSTDNLAEILRLQLNLVNKDIKISYNKVLTKAEVEVNLMYLTEENKINTTNYKIPAVGFVDMQDVTEENVCDVNYEIKNIIIKPNSQEEHCVYIEVEIEVVCDA